MRCPFLTGKYMLYCTALKEVYVPSIFELDEYCKNDGYGMCSAYMKRDAEALDRLYFSNVQNKLSKSGSLKK